jgi:hypothetical protein
MNFLFANAHELAALMELPYIQRLVYLMGIRPYMDRQTCIVGIKRRISYQSLRETLYVAPIAGVKTGSPSHQQMKRAVKSLERAGLIKIQSTEKHLIMKCIFAELDKPVQNKADPRPTFKPDTNPSYEEAVKLRDSDDGQENPDTANPIKADPPNKSEVNYIFLLQKFEKFWESYPEKKGINQAWEVFKNLNPDEALYASVLTAIEEQIADHRRQQRAGHWTPPWKHPANWLMQRCWEDEVKSELLQVNKHDKRQTYKKQSPVDLLWESCKGGAEFFDFDFEEKSESKRRDNIIQFDNK